MKKFSFAIEKINFEYINADYHWICDEPFIGYRVCERAIFYFQYDENVYEEAKRYTLENMMLSDTVTEVYGNYIFYDNLKGNDDFPNKFWRVAYNDNNHTLVFVAFYVSVELYDEAKLAEEDWGAFLEKYYSEWYSFEE